MKNRPNLKPLSEKEEELRKPLKPEILMDALQDPLPNLSKLKSRPGKAIRKRKKENSP